MPGVFLWGWDATNEKWIPVRCDADGFILVRSIELDEIRLVPKASSTGAEGAIYYDSDDDHIYVATE